MWLFRNNPQKKITDQFATLRIWGSYVGLHLALWGMNHAQDFTSCSADFDARPWSD
jgi:hypothetical protein